MQVNRAQHNKCVCVSPWMNFYIYIYIYMYVYNLIFSLLLLCVCACLQNVQFWQLLKTLLTHKLKMFDNRAKAEKNNFRIPTVYFCCSCFQENIYLLLPSSSQFLPASPSLRHINHLSQHLRYWLVCDPEWRPGNSNLAPRVKTVQLVDGNPFC